jgi:hypothetical protein
VGARVCCRPPQTPCVADLCWLPEELAGLTLRETLARRFKGRPVVGDRLDLGDIELVAREVVGGQVAKVGLVIDKQRVRGSGG